VTWDATTKQATFAMPAYDVELQVVYIDATIYESDGVTEKASYASLKEAFANVQNGDVIKLDWNITLTEMLETPSGATNFTLDLNGYIIDGMTPDYAISLQNSDQMTITDSSQDEKGGLKCKGLLGGQGAKFIFDGGRYTIGETTAELLNTQCQTATGSMLLARGKEFIALNGGELDDDDFMARVHYKDFELTIGAQEFTTFYLDRNIKLADETPAGVGLYTISNVNADRSEAAITALTGVVEAGLPMLIYNDTDAEQTVTIKVTADEADAENQGITPIEYFQGTAKDREFTADDMNAADYYALNDGQTFYSVLDPGILGANQCWLEFAKQQTTSARQFTIVFEEGTTELNEIKNDKPTDDNLYDLYGRKLDGMPAAKGVYIMNGRKVVIK
jgi:hypothetical protein